MASYDETQRTEQTGQTASELRESHATDAQKAAQQAHGEAMDTESKRYAEALDALNAEHEAKVREISDTYTAALAEADNSTSA